MKISILPLTLLVLLAASQPVKAETGDDWTSWPTTSRFSIGAGYFAPDLDTTIVVTDENNIVGTGISFERNLGLDDNEGTELLYAEWRFLKRHSLQYRYFDLKRSAIATSSTVSIAIGEEVFDISLPIQSFFRHHRT